MVHSTPFPATANHCSVLNLLQASLTFPVSADLLRFLWKLSDLLLRGERWELSLFLAHLCIPYSFKNWDKGFYHWAVWVSWQGCAHRAGKTNESEENRVADNLGSRAEHTTSPLSSHSDDDSFTMLLLKLLLSHKTISHSLLCLSFWGARVPDWWPQRPNSTASGTCLGPDVLSGHFQSCTELATLLPHPTHSPRLPEPGHYIIELHCLDMSLPRFQQPGGPRKLLVHLTKIQYPLP